MIQVALRSSTTWKIMNQDTSVAAEPLLHIFFRAFFNMNSTAEISTSKAPPSHCQQKEGIATATSLAELPSGQKRKLRKKEKRKRRRQAAAASDSESVGMPMR